MCTKVARLARCSPASFSIYRNAPTLRCVILDVKNVFTSKSYRANLFEYRNTVRITHRPTETIAMRSNFGLSNRRDPIMAAKLNTLMRSNTNASAGRNTNFVLGSTAGKFAIGTPSKVRISMGGIGVEPFGAFVDATVSFVATGGCGGGGKTSCISNISAISYRIFGGTNFGILGFVSFGSMVNGRHITTTSS